MKYKAGDIITATLNEGNAHCLNSQVAGYLCNIRSEQIISHQPSHEPIVGYVNVYNLEGKGIHLGFEYETFERAKKEGTSKAIAVAKFTYCPTTKKVTAEVVE
jgi:hypothetical protein